MTLTEPTNIGLTESGHAALKRLKEDGHFAEMADAYRFAIALALSHNAVPDEMAGARANIFNVGTIDPDREIYAAIHALIEVGAVPVYRWAERLADWGVHELARRSETGLDIGSLLKEVQQISEK